MEDQLVCLHKMLKKKINPEIAGDYEQLWTICQFENSNSTSGEINTVIVMGKKDKPVQMLSL